MSAFPWRMAWRETRAGWRHFVYCVVSIAVGVGALVTVSVFAANVERTVTLEARSLLGGDLEVRLSRPISQEGAAILAAMSGRGHILTHVSELIAMAAAPERSDDASPVRTQIIELKAVEPSYPLYGSVGIDPASALSSLLPSVDGCRSQSCHGAVVQETLLIRLGLAVGEFLRIGQATFEIRGVLTKEPDRMANAFSLGPRVVISQEGLVAAGLVKPGSRIRERYLMRTMGGADLTALTQELRGRLSKDSPHISTYREAQPQLKRFLEQLTRYLGLVGLTALFVGGIGVATTVHSFIREKIQSIAILKTLGASTPLVVHIYLLQATLLAAVGSTAGVAAGLAVQGALPALLRTAFATDLLDQLDFSSRLTVAELAVAGKGVALGLLTALLFASWPVLAIRDIRPSAILRRLTGLEGQSASLRAPTTWLKGGWRRLDPGRSLATIAILAGLGLLAMWQALSWRVGLVYLAGLVTAVLLLHAAARLLIRLLRALPPRRSLVLRYAVANIYRPGSQAAGIMMAVGLALMVIVAVSVLEQALLDQVTTNRPDDAPTFFFIDIQPDQREGVLALIHHYTGAVGLEALPLLRSRLAAVNGEPIKVEEESDTPSDRQDERRRVWYQTREYVLTMLDQLPKDNRVVQGKWWPPGHVLEMPQVSVEEEAAHHLGLTVGSTLAVDIQGTVVTARVSSIRKVEWNNFSTNFYMIFSPGSLEGAPFTYVATVRASQEQHAPLLQAMVADYPNVTGIHIGDVLDSFARMLDRLALAIRAVALFSVATGALVMATALSATRYRRLYESVIFKALGATRLTIARTFAWEYALLGGIAGVIGIGLANLLSWGLLEYLFDVSWSFHPRLLVASLLATVALTLITGFFSSFSLLGRRPLAVLRHE